MIEQDTILKRWCTIAPIDLHCCDDNIFMDDPITLGDNVTLSKSPIWFREFAQCKDLCIDEQGEIEHSEYILCNEYDAINRSEPDRFWQGKYKKEKGRKIDQELMYANLAIWLAFPLRIGFKYLFDFYKMGDRWKIYGRGRYIDRLVPNKHYKKNTLSFKNLETAKSLFQRLRLFLNYSDSTIKRCASTLHWALLHADWDHRYLLLWMALETLFTPMRRKRITNQLVQNIAFFLGSNNDEIGSLIQTINEYYYWRCLIVHGRSLEELVGKTPDLQLSIQYETEELVRKSLLRILADERRTAVFDSPSRDKYLKSLSKK
ncbi:MAG: hypothetical protein WBB67_09050 [bacterium]